jgi:hypothetical protein
MDLHEERALLSDWLGEVTYLPGSSFELANLTEHLGVWTVRFQTWVFDATQGQRVEILRGRHIAVSVPTSQYEWEHHDVGPDLVGGPLALVMADWVVPAFLPQRGRAEFYRWLRDCLHKWAVHESDEWLQVGGRALFDPHAEQERRDGPPDR